MLSILIYAYFEGITSSRKIEKCVRKSIPYIYLAGSNEVKYHSICDFRKKHLIPFRSILSASIRLALDSGLVKESDLFSLDGSKNRSRCLSGSMTKRKEKMGSEKNQIFLKTSRYIFLKKWDSETDTAEDVLEEIREGANETSSLAYLDEILKTKTSEM